MDKYQERYTEHIKRKNKFQTRSFTPEYKEFGYLETRRSQRVFTHVPIADGDMEKIYRAITLSPTSCNRQGILIKEVEEVEYLVGGEGWINSADRILLLFADMKCYKSPNEKEFMPYLDAGHISMTVQIACEMLGIGSCFVNPNVKEGFDKYNPKGLRFCGALALGHYQEKMIEPTKSEDIRYD